MPAVALGSAIALVVGLVGATTLQIVSFYKFREYLRFIERGEEKGIEYVSARADAVAKYPFKEQKVPVVQASFGNPKKLPRTR